MGADKNPVEKRIDDDNGGHYTYEEFKERYPDEYREIWNLATIAGQKSIWSKMNYKFVLF